MDVSVFGLGYVGAVSAACLAAAGHRVCGVDKHQGKVDLLNSGRSPVIEPGVEERIATGRAGGALRATTDAGDAVRASTLSLVCVGTPSERNGSLDLRFVRRVCAEIGEALATLDRFHVVVIRSTALPGTMRSLVIPTLEQASGRVAGRDFGVCFNPEFLREGSAVRDHHRPPKTVLGEIEPRAGDALLELYRDIDAPLIRTSLEVAEMVKYVDNAWHALKVGFANEVGTLAKALSIDGHEVMDIFCRDTKLNISTTYLKPGYAFGGSCLPKDLRALTHRARELDVEAPILAAILPSNDLHVKRGLDLVMSAGNKRVGVLGFSFKAGTDDLRESPVVELIERLIGKGYDLLVYDRNVELARLTGANRDYILGHVPHIASLMRSDVGEVLEHGDTIVVGNADPEFGPALSRLNARQAVIDLVRVAQPEALRARYEGIGW